MAATSKRTLKAVRNFADGLMTLKVTMEASVDDDSDVTQDDMNKRLVGHFQTVEANLDTPQGDDDNGSTSPDRV